MKNEAIYKSWESIVIDEAAHERMLGNITKRYHERCPKRERKEYYARQLRVALPTAAMLMLLVAIFLFSRNNFIGKYLDDNKAAVSTAPAGTQITLADKQPVTPAVTSEAAKVEKENNVESPPVRGTGGDFLPIFGYKMDFWPEVFVTNDIRAEYNAWCEQLEREKYELEKTLTADRHSLYVFIHKFNVAEATFREQNKKLIEQDEQAKGQGQSNSPQNAFTEEEIHDLYNLSRAEFNKKYASVWVILKGEKIYALQRLLQVPNEDFAKLGITKEDIFSQLDRARLEHAQLADIYIGRFLQKFD